MTERIIDDRIPWHGHCDDDRHDNHDEIVAALETALDGWEQVLNEEPRCSKSTLEADRRQIDELRKLVRP